MLSQEQKELFGVNTKIIEKDENSTKYRIECDTLGGVMSCYHLFPGVDLVHTSFQASMCFSRQNSLPHILEISYCKNGRIECEYKEGYFTYLGKDDFSVSVLKPHKECPSFPLGYYDGFAIIIDTSVTGRFFGNMVEGISIDFQHLLLKFCSDQCCTVMKSEPGILHVFSEIYSALDTKKMGYLRLKVLEVFLLLSEMLLRTDIQVSSYYSGSSIRKIKMIKNELMQSLDKKIYLKDLSEKYDISLTTMKDCFKAVYGKPIYAFYKEYKMQVATKLLTTGEKPITEIAGMLGYENPNKFSTAFKAVIGCTPSSYRKNN